MLEEFLAIISAAMTTSAAYKEGASLISSAMIKVLLIEDNPVDAQLTKDILAEESADLFDLTQVDQMSEAIRRLRSERFDVALLDLSLPDAHGLETLHQIQVTTPSMPIVVLSGLDDKALALQAVQNGAQDYLVKGRSSGELLARAIRYAIERKLAEEEILQLNAQLEQRVRERTAELDTVNKELEAFSYSVSHDLRAPLRSINGFSQALLEDYTDRLDAEGKEHLRRVRAATQHMGQLIDDLLTLSRVTRSEMRRESVDLSALARAVVTDLQMTEPDRQVTFVIAEGLVVQGDPNLLRLVLENLLGNACKFTGRRAHARIEFGVVQRNGTPTYFVRDDGAGFDMAYVGKLFKAFQRLHDRRQFQGTGIGLVTVQRIIHRHGGEVWAEAAVERGATFYFTVGAERTVAV